MVKKVEHNAAILNVVQKFRIGFTATLEKFEFDVVGIPCKVNVNFLW